MQQIKTAVSMYKSRELETPSDCDMKKLVNTLRNTKTEQRERAQRACREGMMYL